MAAVWQGWIKTASTLVPHELVNFTFWPPWYFKQQQHGRQQEHHKDQGDAPKGPMCMTGRKQVDVLRSGPTWVGLIWRGLWKKGISDDFGCFCFLLQISWIFACDLHFSWKTLLCNYFCWLALCFREITYAKNPSVFQAAIFCLCSFYCLE